MGATGAGAGFRIESKVVCTGPDGKVKWRDGTISDVTLEQLGVTTLEEAEALLKPQTFQVHQYRQKYPPGNEVLKPLVMYVGAHD